MNNRRRTRGMGLSLAIAVTVLALGCVMMPGADRTPEARGDVGIEEGQRAPDFELEDLGGNEVKLSDYRGQVVLINFWATWCGPCRSEFPEIQDVYTRNQAHGFVVLAINVQDRRESVQAYVQELGLTFPVLLDPLGRATGPYKANKLPTSYFIDQEGVIVLKKLGPVNKQIIENVLAQTGVE